MSYIITEEPLYGAVFILLCTVSYSCLFQDKAQGEDFPYWIPTFMQYELDVRAVLEGYALNRLSLIVHSLVKIF